jgi:hypothetical protein
VTSVEALEHRLAGLEHEVADLRRQVRGEGSAHLEQRARPMVRPPAPPRPAPARPESERPAPPPRPARPTKPPREVDLSRLFGAFGLAAAGGVVTARRRLPLRAGREPRLDRPGASARARGHVSVGLFATGFWLRA